MSLDPSAPGWWEAIYAGGEPPWDKGAAAPPLVRALDEVALPVPSRVLVPGCGYGHEAIHLASLGHEVTAVDFAPAAVTALRERCAQAGVPMKTLEADLFDLPAYDLAPFDAVVEHTCFCALDPQRRDAYARLVASLLQGGGWMIGLFFEVEVEIS